MGMKAKLDARIVPLSECGELTDKTVNISRVSKVVKGGRRFSFSALVVSGDGKGYVGFGLGKAIEVPDAIRKATEHARKAMIKVPVKGTSIPHDILGVYGPTTVVMKPAAPGTGVIAGAAVRALVEHAGIKDIRTKVIGSCNAHNVLHATLNGFLSMLDPEEVSSLRTTSMEDLGYHPF